MRTSIKELRVARGWTQRELARRTGIPADRLSRIENKRLGPLPEELRRLSEVLEYPATLLDVASPRACGGQTRSAGEERFYAKPERIATPDWTSAQAIPGLQRDLPGFMRRFNGKLELWHPFLSEAPSEERDETILQLLELERSARITWVSLDYVKFGKWPVTTREGAAAGHLLRPALVTDDYLLVFQVWVYTPRPYRLDGLILVLQPERTFIDMEIDGPHHIEARDREREAAIDLPTLRIPGRDLIKGPSLTERLRALGFCLPPSVDDNAADGEGPRPPRTQP